MLANSEKAYLKINKEKLTFFVEPSPAEKEFEDKQFVHMENLSNSTLKVNMKINYPFSIYLEHEKTHVQEWSYTFGPLEEISVTVIINVKKFKKDKSVYNLKDVFIVSHHENHNESKVPIEAEVVFPSVKISQYEINFGKIVNGTEAVKELMIKNPGDYDITFKWYIKDNSFKIDHKITNYDKFETDPNKPLHFVRPRKEKDFTEKLAKKLYDQINLNTESSTSSSLTSVKQENLVENEGNLTVHSILKEKMFRSKFMEMAGLMDPDSDVEDDEYNYLDCHRPKSLPTKVGDLAINEILDIVPMAGVIRGGQEQKFNVVFYGIPNVKFSAVVVCYIETGSSKMVKISGESVDCKD